MAKQAFHGGTILIYQTRCKLTKMFCQILFGVYTQSVMNANRNKYQLEALKMLVCRMKWIDNQASILMKNSSREDYCGQNKNERETDYFIYLFQEENDDYQQC